MEPRATTLLNSASADMGTYAHHAGGLWSLCHAGSMVREHIQIYIHTYIYIYILYVCMYIYMYIVQVGDWDGDGDLDLIGLATTVSMQLVDWDGDGDLDLLVFGVFGLGHMACL